MTTPTERIKALMLQASLMSGLLRPGTVAPLREAMSLLPADADPVLRARVLEALARRLLLAGEIDEGILAAQEAVAASVDTGSATAEANARITLASGLNGRGGEDEAQPEWDRAGVLARGNSKTELRFFINYSDALHLSGCYAEAVQPGNPRDRSGPEPGTGAFDRVPCWPATPPSRCSRSASGIGRPR